jgi:5'-phosphate synthase pdxT subunit
MCLEIGVISIQGAVSEHVDTVERAAVELGIAHVHTSTVRKIEELDKVSGVIIPGGESTTISKLLVKFKLYDRIIARAKDEGLPILGTCAGCIVLATEGDSEVSETDTKLLGLMDMRVRRNAFGRQGESFESDISILGFDRPYHAVFIRAPLIENVWGKCKILARLDDSAVAPKQETEQIVLAQQGNLLAAAFHPELTEDPRIHEYFLGMI